MVNILKFIFIQSILVLIQSYALQREGRVPLSIREGILNSPQFPNFPSLLHRRKGNHKVTTSWGDEIGLIFLDFHLHPLHQSRPVLKAVKRLPVSSTPATPDFSIYVDHMEIFGKSVTMNPASTLERIAKNRE